MNRLALYPTDTLIGHHAPIGTFIVMDCFCKTEISGRVKGGSLTKIYGGARTNSDQAG